MENLVKNVKHDDERGGTTLTPARPDGTHSGVPADLCDAAGLSARAARVQYGIRVHLK